MDASEILEHVCNIYPEYKQYVIQPVLQRVTDQTQPPCDAELFTILKDPIHLKTIWFTAIQEFQRMHYSCVHNVQLYDVPSSGNVCHSVELTTCTALLTSAYYGTTSTPCPQLHHVLMMESFGSLFTTVQQGTVTYFSREAYWMVLYGLSTRHALFDALITSVWNCPERARWSDSLTRAVIRDLVTLGNTRATQWLNVEDVTNPSPLAMSSAAHMEAFAASTIGLAGPAGSKSAATTEPEPEKTQPHETSHS